MEISVFSWAVWLVLILAACGFLAVCWVVAGWAERAADWLRRDRVTPLIEDDEPGPDPWDDGYDPFDELPPPLPPERTWEQMTSHQLPVVNPYPNTDKEREFAAAWGWSAAPRERRMPGWEAESRQAYAALDLEYPSGMLARVRELAP